MPPPTLQVTPQIIPTMVRWTLCSSAAQTTGSPGRSCRSCTRSATRQYIGNPTPLFDLDALEVVLFFCRENSEILSTRSTDAGISWSLPKTIGWSQPLEWAWLATGPPAALLLASGRYVLPCDGYLRLPGARPGATRFYQASTVFSFVLLSDDRGATWRQGPLLDGGNECQVARPTDRQEL